MELSQHRLIFVTGKGGVGKSVCAAAIARKLANEGRRVCLVELGSQSFYEVFFETRGIEYEPSEVIPKVHISLLKPEDCIREYVLHYLKVPKLYDIIFQNRVMKAFLNAAPAVAELSILGKLTSDIRGIMNSEYDVYVVDCFSTGHALALFRAPKGLGSLFKSGPLIDQAHDIDKVLCDPELTHYVLVTLAEELPVNETGELYVQLKKEFNAGISVVCTKLMAPPLSGYELEDMRQWIHDANIVEFLDFIKFRLTQQDAQLSRLRQFAPQFFGVPQILRSTGGEDTIEIFGRSLENPWISTNS